MSARGLLAKPTTRQVMVYIRVFLYQGYDILFYREAHCTTQTHNGNGHEVSLAQRSRMPTTISNLLATRQIKVRGLLDKAPPRITSS